MPLSVDGIRPSKTVTGPPGKLGGLSQALNGEGLGKGEHEMAGTDKEFSCATG